MEKNPVASTCGTNIRWRSVFSPFLMLFPLVFKGISVLAWALKVRPSFGNNSLVAWRRHGATLENVISASFRGWPSPVAARQDRLASHYTLAFRETCRHAKVYLVSGASVGSRCRSSGYNQLSRGHLTQPALTTAKRLCQQGMHSSAGYPPSSHFLGNTRKR